MNTTGLRYRGKRMLGMFVAAAMAVVALVACSEDMPQSPTGEEHTDIDVVSFRILAPKTSATRGAATRATWGDEYVGEDGNDFETSLLRYQLCVAITDAACTEQYAVTNLVCTRVTDAPYAVEYEYRGRVNEEDVESIRQLTDGKLHIMANAGHVTAFDSDITFTLSGQPGNGFTAIPMWGVKTVDFSAMEANATLSVGDVSLLRAMAKVVIDKDNAEGNFITSIKAVTVSATNAKGYLLPDGWASVTDTKTMDRHAVRVPEQELTSPLTFATSEDSHVEFYLPEIANHDEDGEIRMTLTFDTKMCDEWTADLYFRNYVNGDPTGLPYDIRRNYLYRYVVNMPVYHNIDATVDVIPFTTVELNPIFGLDREDFTGYVHGKDEDGHECWYKDGDKYYLGPNGNHGEYVTINGTEYMLVYSDYQFNKKTTIISGYERTPYNLSYIIEKETRKVYLVDPIGRTGYREGNDMYLNKLSQRVWLDSGGDPDPQKGDQSIYLSLQKIGLNLKCCCILYEWDRYDWNKARWWGWTGVYPKFWFDVLGNKYPWSDGDTEEKRKAILGDWVKYLE